MLKEKKKEAIGEDDEEEGGANWKKFQDPKLPSSDEQRLHNITPVPYRSWCDHCVKGKAKRASHTKQEEKERTMPEVHVDYCFMGTNEDDKEKLLTILVAKERDSGMMMSTIVPKKGSTGEFAAKRLNAFIKEIGCEFHSVCLLYTSDAADE